MPGKQGVIFKNNNKKSLILKAFTYLMERFKYILRTCSLSMYNCIIIQEIIQLLYKLFSSSDKKSFKSESIKLYIKLDKTKYLLFSFEL